jgi:hypothetical protein
MKIAIQEVVVLWTKASRVEPLRSRLAGLPRVFPWSGPPSVGACAIQRIGFSERDGFLAGHEEWRRLDGCIGQEGGVAWRAQDGALRIDYSYERSRVGLPQRCAVTRTGLLLPGQWGQVCYNGRIPDRASTLWVFCERAFNIAWLDDVADAPFPAAVPTWRIEDRGC